MTTRRNHPSKCVHQSQNFCPIPVPKCLLAYNSWAMGSYSRNALMLLSISFVIINDSHLKCAPSAGLRMDDGLKLVTHAYVDGLMLVRKGTLVDSNLLASVTLLPKRQYLAVSKKNETKIINSSLGCKYYLGIFRPTTPAKTVPVCSPMRIFKKEANEKTDVLLKQLEIRKRWPGAVLLSASLILKLKMKYVYVQQKQLQCRAQMCSRTH